MTVYYPRRTDGVVAITYKDSQSIRDIQDALGGHPEITITVRPDRVDILAVDGFRATPGSVVVIDPRTVQVREVMDPWDFKGKYSKDGL